MNVTLMFVKLYFNLNWIVFSLDSFCSLTFFSTDIPGLCFTFIYVISWLDYPSVK